MRTFEFHLWISTIYDIGELVNSCITGDELSFTGDVAHDTKNCFPIFIFMFPIIASQF